MLTIAAFPKKGTPYTECFYEALEKKGVAVLEGDFSIRWLRKEIGSIDYFHFHWPSLFYAHRDDFKKTLHDLFRFLLYLIIIKFNGRKVLWTAHNLYPHDKGRKFSVAIDIFVRHVITIIASFVFVHGATAAKILIEKFPRTRKKILIIDHGHWVGFYKNQLSKALAREKIGIPNGKFIYLFIGICKRYKNISTLVKTFKQISGNVILVIVGKFQEESYFKEVTNLVNGEEDRIRIIAKYIPDDELQFYINACDVVVLPYSEILTSGAAMLAISFGKPIIAPKKGYLEDMINDSCGILYQSEDPNGLLNALMEIQKKSFDEKHIIKHALTFDWDKVADLVFQKIAK
jgi:glycosyltransferase involved in cell wall biosynthesis